MNNPGLDYLRNAWGRDAGRLVAASVDRKVRASEKASDHAPV